MPNKSVRMQWVLDVQWSDAPEAVEKEVHQIWIADDRLHNDVCIKKWGSEDWSWNLNHPEWTEGDQECESRYPETEAWLLANGVPVGEVVWIHWWW